MIGDKFFEVTGAFLEQEGRREAAAENSARRAYSVHHLESSGVGQHRPKAVIDFDVVFLERPTFLQGGLVAEGPTGAEWNLPVATAGVWRWKRNTLGHYLGAWVFLDVRLTRRDGSIPTAWPSVRCIHDMTFMGVAYKDLGSGVTMQIEQNAVRSVGFGGVS